MSSFHPDDPGYVCRSDSTIKFVGRKLWSKEKIKVNRTDEVRKTVIGQMRNLACLYIEFKQLRPETMSAKEMFNREYWNTLEAALLAVTTYADGTVKYGLKQPIIIS